MASGPNIIQVWRDLPGSTPLKQSGKDFISKAFWRKEKNGNSIRLHPEKGEAGTFHDFSNDANRGGRMSLVAVALYGDGASQDRHAISEASKYMVSKYGINFEKAQRERFSGREVARARSWFYGASQEIENTLKALKERIWSLPDNSVAEEALARKINRCEDFRTELNAIHLSIWEKAQRGEDGYAPDVVEKVVYQYRAAMQRDETHRGDRSHQWTNYCVKQGREIERDGKFIASEIAKAPERNMIEIPASRLTPTVEREPELSNQGR